MRLMGCLLFLGLAGCNGGEPQSAPARPVSSPQPVAAVMAPVRLELPPANVVMEVMQVVGKSEAEVSALLGRPSSCEDIHRARLCRYPPDEDEVMFVAGKADMITVQQMDAVAFNADALDALGLGPVEPDHSNEHAIRWESIPELEEVTVFPGQGGSVDYAYVKVGKH